MAIQFLKTYFSFFFSSLYIICTEVTELIIFRIRIRFARSDIQIRCTRKFYTKKCRWAEISSKFVYSIFKVCKIFSNLSRAGDYISIILNSPKNFRTFLFENKEMQFDGFPPPLPLPPSRKIKVKSCSKNLQMLFKILFWHNS